ncbi:hypothetical protein D3C73_852030 [compost metagenome]
MLALIHLRHIKETLIVGCITGQLGKLQMVDNIDDFIHKFSIMGDQDERIRVLLQIVRQPVNMLHIQIVGRLIQQQYIGLLQQQLGQQDFRALSPA